MTFMRPATSEVLGLTIAKPQHSQQPKHSSSPEAGAFRGREQLWLVAVKICGARVEPSWLMQMCQVQR